MTEAEWTKTAVLHDGRVVSTMSEEWKIECEARYLLRMPLQQRRHALERREQIRGVKSVEKLRERMKAIHAARKARAQLSPMPP